MQKKTEEVLNKLEDNIVNGNVGASGFLPSERDLCKEFSIGRGALRAVFDELIRRKRICHIPGKGMKLVFQERETAVFRKYILVMPANGARTGEIANILCGAASAAAEHNAQLLLFFNKDDFVGSQLAALLADGSCDGVIYLDRFPAAISEAMEQTTLRYVVANLEQGGNIPSVRVDLRGVGRVAGHYLVEHGFRHIGFIGGGPNPYIYTEMMAGLKGALAEDDLIPTKELCVLFKDSYIPEDGDKAAENIIANVLKSKEPCAIFAGRDHWAKRLWEAATRQNLRIPEDISIIGYDNVSWPDGRYMGLTTIEQPTFKIGETALELLNNAAETMQPVESALIQGTLVERSSVKNIIS